MTPSIEERELAIESLLELAECHEVNWPSLLITLGATDRENAIERICELADPSTWKLAVADNERLLDRCRELEAETPDSRRLWQRGMRDENPVLASTSDQVRADATHSLLHGLRQFAMHRDVHLLQVPRVPRAFREGQLLDPYRGHRQGRSRRSVLPLLTKGG